MLQSPDPRSAGLITFASTFDPRTGWLQVPLESLAAHREEYLRYEGPVSRGRGKVQRVASGRIRWIESLPEKLTFDLIEMDFLEPPFAPWPTGRYCVTRGGESPDSPWRLFRY